MNKYNNPAEHEKYSLVNRIEDEIHTELAPPFRDVAYRCAQDLSDVMYKHCAEEKFPTRGGEALEHFNRNFMEREISRVKGNITQYVRDAFGTDDDKKTNNLRRNVYRKIGKYGLGDFVDSKRPWKQADLDDRITSKYNVQAATVESTLTNTLQNYRATIHPEQYDKLSAKINEKSPVIAESISAYMPNQDNRLNRIFDMTTGVTNYNEARQIFEKQIIYDALEAAGFDKKKTAEYLGDSTKTLDRRMTSLGINDNIKLESKEKIEDIVVKNKPNEMPAEAISETERFKQLVEDYNSKREDNRKGNETDNVVSIGVLSNGNSKSHVLRKAA